MNLIALVVKISDFYSANKVVIDDIVGDILKLESALVSASPPAPAPTAK